MVCAQDAGPLPIDTEYVRMQRPDLHGCRDPSAEYLKAGLAQCIDPTKFFNTDWYAWQNPDWSNEHDAPYLHYLQKGCGEGRDPSPFVDIEKFVEATGGRVPKERIYHLILGGLRAPALGVYEDVSDLERAQKAFLDGIHLLSHRMTCHRPPKPALVVCQAGRGARVDEWLGSEDREWDCLLNYYDAGGMRAGMGDFVVLQKGTKFTAMKLLLERFTGLFAQYSHVLFIDDDVETSAVELNRLFALCRRHDLDLAQMSLTTGSWCNWQHLYTRKGVVGPRAVSAVEIMMPVFSSRALRWIRPTLGQSVSGFGLDLVWGQIVAEQGGRIAVLDEVSATHARPVDQVGGAYYQYLRRHGINAKAELWTMLKRYGAPRDVITT
ncbi:MAG: hypothetical protein HKP35_01985 [Silicimonas sp.]|nr:hypothetical protein [Silicimonas sp.]